jgi:2-oxoglutarate dehydrogenase E2 component (dihydrolipoamide succinyltransferase)
MGQVEMIMPKMGESIMEATVLTWLKKEGESIDQDESVLEVATDKVDTEVPATHPGVLKKILVKEGDVVPVGNAIAIIETEVSSDQDEENIPVVVAEEIKEVKSISNAEPIISTVDSNPILKSRGSKGRFYSPLVLNISRTEGISMAELESLSGSGKGGRVTKKDIIAYQENRKNGGGGSQISPQSSTVVEALPSFGYSVSGKDEVIEMDRMRKMIAQRMVESKRISPHVTSFVEADVTRIVKWRNAHKSDFERKEGQKLTFTPLFIKAVVETIKDFPRINISVDGTKIILKKDINIGMAVALPNGNLIVPVIKNADRLNLKGLALKVNELAAKARSSSLGPDDLSGGTFTISNVGSFGNLMGTPIILQPQVAILALGSINKKPSVIETEDGDMIGIRSKMFLSHSYDHRVVDGSLGGMFVKRVAEHLEGFDPNTSV